MIDIPNPQRLLQLGKEIAQAEKQVGHFRAQMILRRRDAEARSAMILANTSLDGAKNETARKIFLDAALYSDEQWSEHVHNMEGAAAALAMAEGELSALKAERRGIEWSLMFGNNMQKETLETLTNQLWGPK